ncbi:MAG: MMPL family transporter [Myxococcota bacterium]
METEAPTRPDPARPDPARHKPGGDRRSTELTRRYVGTLARHRYAVVFLWLSLAVAGWMGAKRLRVDTNLRALLPPDTPSLQALDALRASVDASAPLYVHITSKNPALNAQIAERIAAELRTWPETRWAIDRKDPSYFLQHRLLYLPAEELSALADDVEMRVEWEECAAIPGCVNLDDKVALPTEASLRDLFESQPGHAELIALLGGDAFDTHEPVEPRDAPAGHESAGHGESAGGTSAGVAEPDDEPTAVGSIGSEPASAEPVGLMCSEQVCIVQASLDGEAGDVSYATKIYRRGEALLESIEQELGGAEESLHMEIGGRYRNGPLLKQLTEIDLQNTTLLSTALVLFLVLLQFRGPRSILALFCPLAAAILVTLGILGYAGVELNLVSAFTLAVLAGIGIDFGLHLLTHYGRAREAGDLPEDALEGALLSLGRSLLVAGSTTAAAFCGLAAARFSGFSQMGWIAAIGVLLSLCAFLTLFPALLLTMHAVWKEKHALFRPSPIEQLPLPSPRIARTIAITGIVVGIGMAVFAAQIEFEHEFQRLRNPGVSNTIKRHGAIRGPGGVSVYMMAEKPEDLLDIQAVRESKLAEGAVVLTPQTLIPPDQEAKLSAIHRMKEAIGRVEGRLEGEAKRRVDRIRPLLVERPVRAADLPQWAADYVADRSGQIGRIGVAYLPMRGSNARKMETLAEELDGFRKAHPGIVFASPEALLGEVVPALRGDAPRILLLALLGLAIAVIFIGRSVHRTFLVLLPVLLAVSIGLGIAVLLGIRLNLYNLLVLPVAFGVGVDGAIYVVWALLGDAPLEERWRRLTVSARAVIGSTATTVAAFGSIMIAGNPGLASIGSLAVITVSMTLLANVFWLPAAMLWWSRRPAKAPAPDDKGYRHT